MRLHVLSDLHLEFGSTSIPRPSADVVVLAGDIHLGRDGRKWIRNQFQDRPVVYVLGNHEFYRNSYPELVDILKRETEGSNIHVLENASIELEGMRFLGCTLWTDFLSGLEPEVAIQMAERDMSDYSLVRNSNTNRKLRARDTIAAHNESVAWLKSELSKGNASKTVVVTHHAPSVHSQPSFYSESLLGPAFVSNLDYLVKESGAALWIHGHTHFNVDYKIGSTRVLTNQRGYPDQICDGFNPGLVIEI